ncbi:MAG: FkbM family methyltransferase [Mycobacterium sp.]|nr:FkbM family methyltransferase [Mycobacterium sp.]
MGWVQNPDLIFDIGSHQGEDSDFYLKLGYRVVAVEANPTLAAELRERFSAAIDSGDYVLVENAIGEADGSISFFVNKTMSFLGTINPEWAERNRRAGIDSEEIKVKSIRFAELVEQHGCPHYLKIDIETADMLCVNALKALECRPKYISLESSRKSWSDLMEEFDALENLGYTKFKVVRQVSHKGGYFTGRDGRKVPYTFDIGASGPFGEDLGGRWLTRKQAMRRYMRIFFLYKTIGDNTFISRLFSHLPIVGKNGPVVGGILPIIAGWYDTHAMHG